MRLIIRAITFGAFVLWALTAYARVEDPNVNPDVVPLNEDILKWGLRVTTSMIYFMLKDFFTLFVDVLTKWRELTPERRFGTMLVTVLLITNVMYSLRDRGRREMLRVICPHDQTRAYPIPGSYNRYRCRNGHQFADDAHRF